MLTKYKLASIVFLLLLALGCGSKNKSLLPEELGRFELSSSIEGEEAKKAVVSMHKGAKMTLTKTEIGDYYAGNYTAKLWVGQAENKKSAQILERRMTKAISKGKSPFGKPENVTISGEKLVKLEAMGQIHYYYRVEEKVVWLSVDTDLAADTIPEVVKKIN